MGTQEEIKRLEQAYLLAAATAHGALLARDGVFALSLEAYLLVGENYKALAAKAAQALAEWKAYVGCTPAFEAAYAAQQRTTAQLQAA